jgi:hypothetical protein
LPKKLRRLYTAKKTNKDEQFEQDVFLLAQHVPINLPKHGIQANQTSQIFICIAFRWIPMVRIVQ